MTVEQLTTQQAYEQMRSYFNRPDLIPARDRGGCFYRTPDGRKCAVGCLIPDELYDSGMENEWADTVIISFVTNLNEVEPEFLLDAQRTHDQLAKDKLNFLDFDFGPRFVEDLDSIAERYGLKVVAS